MQPVVENSVTKLEQFDANYYASGDRSCNNDFSRFLNPHSSFFVQIFPIPASKFFQIRIGNNVFLLAKRGNTKRLIQIYTSMHARYALQKRDQNIEMRGSLDAGAERWKIWWLGRIMASGLRSDVPVTIIFFSLCSSQNCSCQFHFLYWYNIITRPKVRGLWPLKLSCSVACL